MNKLVKSAVGSVLLAVVIVGSLGIARAVSPPATPAPGSTLAERIEQRKTEQGTVLNAKDQKRLTTTCAAAQSKLRLGQNDMVSHMDQHAAAYKSVDARLWITIGRLRLANQDTFQLEKQRVTLTERAAAFDTIAANYKQTLDDTLVINCQADPLGFKALLDTTRAYYGQLRAESTDIHDYIVNTIKPTLVGHVTNLQTKPVTDGGSD